MDDKGDLLLFILVCSAAIVFAEYQARQVATARWLLLSTLWVTVVGMVFWVMWVGG